MQKDGSDFQVLAAAPGPIIGPPVEIESAGNRWIYVATGLGDASAPERQHLPHAGGRIGVGADARVRSDPVRRRGAAGRAALVAVPGQNGVYGLTSYASGACVNNFGCGSVYRAVGP